MALHFGVPPTLAVGTDLLFAALTKSAGVSIHGVRGTIDWQVVRRLSLESLPAAALTGWLVYHFHRVTFQVDRMILQALGITLLVTAVGPLARSRMHGLGSHLRLTSASRIKWAQPALTVMAGVLLGVVVSLTSVGAGAIGAVALLYLYPLRLAPARLVGTDLMHAIPLVCIPGASH